MKLTTKAIARTGLMLALVLTLAAAENAVPPLPGLPPGVRLGLANIVIMYCVFFLGRGRAAGLAAAKGLFAAITRGFTAGLLSLCGSLLSVLVIMALAAAFARLSVTAISVAGAVAHNLGQLCAAAVLMGSAAVFGYLPVLIISGAVMGAVTGLTLCAVLPVVGKLKL